MSCQGTRWGWWWWLTLLTFAFSRHRRSVNVGGGEDGKIYVSVVLEREATATSSGLRALRAESHNQLRLSC